MSSMKDVGRDRDEFQGKGVPTQKEQRALFHT